MKSDGASPLHQTAKMSDKDEVLTSKPIEGASRTGRWVQLVPVTVQSVGFLYALAIDEKNGFRWRLNGTVPTIEAFHESLWLGVLAQFLVVERSSGNLIGTVAAYQADLNGGHAYIAASMSDGVSDTGIGIEAVLVFVNFLFATWRLRKLYLDIPEFNLDQIGSGLGSILHEEGRLVGHTYYGGRFWDRVTLAIYHEEVKLLENGGRIPRMKGRADQ